MARHLLSLEDVPAAEIDRLFERAAHFKKNRRNHERPLEGKSVALVFEKASTRTRVSFEVGIHEMGGTPIFMSGQETHLVRGEEPRDVGRVLSRYVHVIAARTYEHRTLLDLAKHADVPVINALSDEEHPCQALADLLTVLERFGTLRGVRLAFIGDGFNVAASLAAGAALAGVSFAIASPDGYSLPEPTLRLIRAAAAKHGAQIDTYTVPEDAVRGADVVYTDVWASMGQEDSVSQRKEAFTGYTVTAKMMALAKPGAIFMHDLPAHRGEEVTDDVIEGAQSVVFDQAENRLHAQKAILALVASDCEL